MYPEFSETQKIERKKERERERGPIENMEGEKLCF